jgi:hypothetical protein
MFRLDGPVAVRAVVVPAINAHTAAADPIIEDYSGKHATAGDCIDSLREALADVLAGELKRHERAPSRL